MPQSLLALLGPQFPQVVLDDIATAARAKWIMLAQNTLGSSKRDYINGIQEIENTGQSQRTSGPNGQEWEGTAALEERTIALVGWLANAVESGMGPYDLRETLLAKWAKTNKDGQKYRSIPFRHGTPGSQGGGGAPMGSRMGPQGKQSLAWAAAGIMSRGQAAKMGKGIYQKARALQANERLGTRRGTGFVPMSSGKRRTAVVKVPKLAPWHKTDIFAGMKRATKQYEKAEQSQYTTFRTISEAEPQGWIHPGIQPRHLAAQVEQFIERIAVKTISAAVTGALKGMSTQ